MLLIDLIYNNDNESIIDDDLCKNLEILKRENDYYHKAIFLFVKN